MEPISATSAALLRLESSPAQMRAGWLGRVDAGAGGAPLDVGELRERIAARLDAAPRFRAVVTGMSGGGAPSGRPARGRTGGDVACWRALPEFAVERHVVAGEPAMGEEELRAAVDRFLAEPLPRDRPLWRVLVVPRRRGGAVVVGTAHRALLDGGPATALRALVFDGEGDSGACGAGAGRAGAGGGTWSGAVGHPADALALDEFRAAARAGALAGARRGSIGATLRHAAFARAERLPPPAPPSFLNPGDGAGDARTLVTARLDLGRLRRIAEHGDAGTAAVVLAVAAGALRRVALAAGEPPEDLRALVPLAHAESELLGDGPCAVVDLPLSERSAPGRLRAVSASLRALGGAGADGPASARAALLAGPPEELPARLALGARVSNVAIPSAHGPERALRLGGARVRALYPLAPAPAGHALTLGTLTYGRHLHVAAAADPAAIRGAGRFPVMLADAVEELCLATGTRGARVVS